MLALIGSLAQSAAAQAACASRRQLFSLVTWTSVGLMGAAAAVAGQNLGAGNPDRAEQAVHAAARIAFSSAALIGVMFLFLPRQLLAVFGMNEPVVVEIGVQLLRVLSVSGLLIAVALTYTVGFRVRAIPRARSTSRSSPRCGAVSIALVGSAVQHVGTRSTSGSRSSSVTRRSH